MRGGGGGGGGGGRLGPGDASAGTQGGACEALTREGRAGGLGVGCRSKLSLSQQGVRSGAFHFLNRTLSSFDRFPWTHSKQVNAPSSPLPF